MTAKKQTQDDGHINLCSDLRELLKTPGGRSVIWGILEMCGIYHDSFTGNSQSYYLEGKRAIGLEILQLMEDTDPTSYARLLLAKHKEKSNA